MTSMTPREIVAELDKHIVGQADAKKAVAVAVRNRWRRQQLPAEVAQDVSPKNILMIGPTGVGKTEIARRLATLIGSPFVKVEATKFTEVGYYGRDVESLVRDLLDASIAMVRAEQTQRVRADAEVRVEDRLLDELLPSPSGLDDEAKERHERTKAKMRQRLRNGEMEDAEVEISLERKANMAGMLGPGMGGMDAEMQGMLEKMMPTRRETKRAKVRDAREMMIGQEAEKLIDQERVMRDAIERAEQSGIVFLDEIDKIAVTADGGSRGPDVSRQGVQRDLLPIVEGSTVVTKHGAVKTDHILFIAAGAFHATKPSDLMPELQGRFPIRVELTDLTKADFVRILTEPKASLMRQQTLLLETEGVRLNFMPDAIDAMAEIAFDVNHRTANTGARRLSTIMERVLEDVSFDATDRAGETLNIDAAYVHERLGEIVQDEDLSKFIL